MPQPHLEDSTTYRALRPTNPDSLYPNFPPKSSQSGTCRPTFPGLNQSQGEMHIPRARFCDVAGPPSGQGKYSYRQISHRWLVYPREDVFKSNIRHPLILSSRGSIVVNMRHVPEAHQPPAFGHVRLASHQTALAVGDRLTLCNFIVTVWRPAYPTAWTVGAA